MRHKPLRVPINRADFVLPTFYTQYSLLTGVEPFYKFCEDDNISELILSGQNPPVDARWTIHAAERSLADLQRAMREFAPLDRPDIEQVVQRLQDTLIENQDIDL